MDNMLSLKSAEDILKDIAERVKILRLSEELTQAGLAKRSGVSLGTLKRFENTGKISLENLIKIAFVLDAQSQFEKLFVQKESFKSIDQILQNEKTRKRGSKN